MIEKNLNALQTLIPKGARLLDIGCGDGNLLDTFRKSHAIRGYGIEKDPQNCIACLKKGLSVYQTSIEAILADLPDHSYDVVILSQTLQEIVQPIPVLKETLRIGKEVIVSFPNFGFWQNRLELLVKGTPPKSKYLPYDWYDTPNIRVISIREFQNLCKTEGIIIKKQIPNYPMANLFAQIGLFVLSY